MDKCRKKCREENGRKTKWIQEIMTIERKEDERIMGNDQIEQKKTKEFGEFQKENEKRSNGFKK